MGRYLDLARRAVEHGPRHLEPVAGVVASNGDKPNHRAGGINVAVTTSDCEISEISEISPGADILPSPATTGAMSRIAVPEPGPGADGQEVWRGWFAERAAIREFDAGYPRPMAERLSYNEAVYRWHRLFGARPDPACCAGCDQPVSGREAWRLPGGARVHVDNDYHCLIEYGRRWRSPAVEALAAHGLTPPEGWQL